jgi:PAS domain S-box-containing protein
LLTPKPKYLVGIFLVFVALGCFLFYLIYAEAKNRAIAALNARQQILARQAKTGIEDYFQGTIQILNRLAQVSDIVEMSPAGREKLDFAFRMNRGDIQAITRLSATGEIRYTTPATGSAVGRDISNQSHIQKILQDHEPVASDVFSTIQGFPAIALHVPVFENRRFRGTLGVLIDFKKLSRRFLEGIRIGETGYAWVVSASGIELFCPVPGHIGNSVFENCEDFPSILAMGEEMVAGREGVTTYTFNRIRDQKRERVFKHAVYMTIRIADTFWSIVVSSSEEELLGTLVEFKNKLILLFGLFLLGGAVFAFFGLRAWNVIRNEAERARVEAGIRRSEARFRKIVEKAPLPMVITDEGQDVLSYNQKFTEVFGYTEADAGTQEQWWELAYPDPEYRKKVRESWDGAIQKALAENREIAPQEWEPTTRDGVRLTCQFYMVPLGDVGVIIIQNVTEQRRLEAQLHQARKMEAVGRLAGGVAHDFNNMLSIILGNAEMARDDLTPGTPPARCLEEIRKAAERSGNLTRQLLAFARKQTIAPRVLDLNETVSGMLQMLRRLIGEAIELEWRPAPELWRVKVDPSQVDQLLANLCVNARDAISGTGRVVIETRNVPVDEESGRNPPDLVPGDFVRIAVSDDGRGIKREVLDNLFEPFFTTKELGRGTGLGLATVYGIVKQNEGVVNVDSEPGRGATFTVDLPRFREAEGAGAEVDSGRGAPPGHETILLVEDEAPILDMTRMMLERLGYTVLAAAAPAEARRLADAHPGEIHLLLTDVVMPEMSGRELAGRLRERRPGLRRLYMSGYTADVIAHHGVLDEGVPFIHKPFSRRELAVKLREALG